MIDFERIICVKDEQHVHAPLDMYESLDVYNINHEGEFEYVKSLFSKNEILVQLRGVICNCHQVILKGYYDRLIGIDCVGGCYNHINFNF